MNFPSFNQWLLLKEGKKKSTEEKQAYNAFISGKTNKIKLSSSPVAIGHQPHASGVGAFKNKKAYDRKVAKKDWQSE